MYYGLMGMLIVFLVGIPVSYLTGTDEEIRELNLKLLTPFARKFVPKSSKPDPQIEVEMKSLWISSTDLKEQA